MTPTRSCLAVYQRYHGPMLLTEILPRAARLHADSEAVVCGSTRLTYRELADRVARLASALNGLGLRPGDCMAVIHRNCHRMLELYFAAAHLGVVLAHPVEPIRGLG